jgi:hypothetical protein
LLLSHSGVASLKQGQGPKRLNLHLVFITDAGGLMMIMTLWTCDGLQTARLPAFEVA